MTINYNTSHLKSLKNQNRRAGLGRPAIKLHRGVGGGGEFQLVCGRPTKNNLIAIKTSHTHFHYIHKKYTRLQKDPLKP